MEQPRLNRKELEKLVAIETMLNVRRVVRSAEHEVTDEEILEVVAAGLSKARDVFDGKLGVEAQKEELALFREK